MVSAVSERWLWREDLKEKRKKVKIFACIFAFLGFYDDFWLWSRDIQFEGLGVCGSRLSEVFSDERFGFGRREGKKKCRRREEKRKREDKKGCPSGMIIFTTLHGDKYDF